MEIKRIATVRTPFPEKFGIPRQSGIVGVRGEVVFLPEYRDREAVRGLEDYSHIWLLWEFSEAKREGFSPTVRPPRLGGNRRMGVFATRSPFRPNPIGLSSVKLLGVRFTDEGPILDIEGADLLDGTPVYDVKPYLAYTDSHPEAKGGFSDAVRDYALRVDVKDSVQIPEEIWGELKEILASDPRPSYQDDPTRDYFLAFGKATVTFRVADGTLTVTDFQTKR